MWATRAGSSLRGRPSRLPCAFACFKPDFTRSNDDGALELGEDAHHLEQRFAGGRAGVDALLMHVQLAAPRVDFAQNSKEVLK